MLFNHAPKPTRSYPKIQNMRLIKIFIAVAILMVSNSTNAQDTTRVLFIGNSFTGANNLPNLFEQLAANAGHHVVIGAHTPGGISVGDIRQGNQAHMNNPYVYNLIKGDDWDYLVLQDNQGRFSHPRGKFPDPSFQSKVIEGHLRIRDSLLYYHPCAHMIWFGGFGTKNGLSPDFTSGVAMIDSIYQNYKFLNDTAHQVIAPIGPAFKRIIAAYPAIDLWGGDATHPSLHGSFLTACVIYTTVFKQSPLLSTYNPGISASHDTLLKTVGYQTTLDSLNFTGLDSITPLISRSNDTLVITGYPQCSWFYNDAPYPSANCTAIMDQVGRYSAIVTDSKGCMFKAWEYELASSNVNYEQLPLESMAVYPNPGTGKFKLKLSEPGTAFSYILTTSGGKIIDRQDLNLESVVIDLTNHPKGLYILQVNVKGALITKKILKE
ncbi:MAG: hypothetical protein CMI36_05215 [Owenweeksia sp.]|nr:hypothetical protein [Owenweeksia sp.]MBF98371.1 hypothetical protein [Owenweeksia sp.]HCQ16800.1 hypothetical protein [Cryomorphaceae bacterium]|tara:strand:+ start:2880 stop:4187 length:1308 start_codon:yes stop_codon:yes gene_type:complete